MLQLLIWKKEKKNDLVDKEKSNHIKEKDRCSAELVMDDDDGDDDDEKPGLLGSC
jgi:hypothetical protein